MLLTFLFLRNFFSCVQEIRSVGDSLSAFIYFVLWKDNFPGSKTLRLLFSLKLFYPVVILDAQFLRKSPLWFWAYSSSNKIIYSCFKLLLRSHYLFVCVPSMDVNVRGQLAGVSFLLHNVGPGNWNQVIRPNSHNSLYQAISLAQDSTFVFSL